MITPAPTIVIHAIDATASEDLARLLAPRWAGVPYTAGVDAGLVAREILTPTPPAYYAVRWQQHRHLAAYRAGKVIGFLDAAVGIDADSQDVPDYHPFGLLRFLALPEHGPLVAATARALLDAAHTYWRKAGVGYVKAFHLTTGYPSFQAGAGILPGDWGDHVRVLTEAGFFLHDRYYCYARRLTEPVEEVTPLADLGLVHRGEWENRRYEIYHRRVERVAWARLVRMTLPMDDAPFPVAKLVEIFVDPQWRHKDIGKWLLRRIINDATHLGDTQLVVHLAQQRHVAINLLVQQGFHELSYRGYSLEKALTE